NETLPNGRQPTFTASYCARIVDGASTMFSKRTDWSLETNELTRLANQRRQLGLPLLDLTESNPTRCGFNYDAAGPFASLVQYDAARYSPDPRGPLAARQALTAYYKERGVTLDATQIFLTASTSEAYSFVFKLLADPGEHVLAPRPSYPLFEFLARLDDVQCTSYPIAYEDRWSVNRSVLAAHAASNPKAVIVVHPNNPTGSFIHPDEADFLIEQCRRYGTALIADEVFWDYLHPGKESVRAPSFAGQNRALAFTLSGLSKVSGLPQMKCSWIVVSGPPDERELALARLEVIADTYLSVSAPVAHALPELLAFRRVIQPQICERVAVNLRRLGEFFGTGLAPSRFEAEGGWSAVLRLPATQTDEDWAISLLRDDGIFVHPGHFYDFAQEGCVVVSLLPPPTIFEEGVRTIAARVRQHATPASG
ncbi:MAG: pyridoxal phosphate-dependent aminotransferase, partial [Terriglobia bacterium]